MAKKMIGSPILWCLLLALFSFSYGGPLTFNSALPLPQHQNVVRFLEKVVRKENNKGDKVLAYGSITLLGFSQSEKNALFLVAPYLSKTLKSKGVTRKTNGVGDLRLWDRLTVRVNNLPGRTIRTSFFGGLKVPTGDWNDTDALGVLPRTLQVGTGAWAGFLGISFSDQAFDRELDFALQAELNGTAHGYQFGHSFRLDGSFQKRLLPRKLSSGVPSFLYGIVEINLQKQLKDKQDRQEVAASGGFTLNVVPGIQYVTRRFVVEGGINIPLMQSVPSGGLEDKVSFLLGARHNF